MENFDRELSVNAEKLTLEIERFSGLSSEMIALLSSLSREINKSGADLQEIRAAVDLKRKELQTLHEIENSAAVLEQQIQDLQRQKESLEKIVEDRRGLWEKEKERRANEEKEYYENLNLRRQQEEQQFKEMWAAEHEKARQQLEDELLLIQQQTRDAQEAAERDFQERELILKKKELEWGQLIHELEQFLFKLERRNRPHNSFHAVSANEQPADRSTTTAPGSPASGHLHDNPGFSEPEDASKSGFHSEENLMWGATGDEKGFTSYDNDTEPIFGRDLAEEPRQSLQPKRESSPLKFSPKRSADFRPED